MRVILITGTSSGLGRALALEYAAPGTTLILIARRLDRIVEISGSVEEKGGISVLYEADVRNREQMEKISGEILSGIGVPDIIVANAGIRGGRHGNDRETMEALFDTNVMGVMNTVLPFLPSLRESRKGQIAILGSLAGYRGLPDAGAYCASKAALRAWTDSLRFEAEPCNVLVSLINPGFVRTEMTRTNPYPMPFILTAEEAANRIRRGLERKKALIEFPFPLVLAVRLLALLPPRSSDRIFRFFRRNRPDKGST
jgi:short-subunit dehydrogenase